jgi:hypothetical protein
MFAARARLASTLLLLCWIAGALNGCLLSQEDRVLNIPAQQNRPPRIIEERLDPRDRVRRVPDCSRLEFTFRAEDPDVNDQLKVRWYVDYQRTQSDILDNEQVLAPSGQPERLDPGYLSVDLTSALGLPASQLQVAGSHVVEAVLFDNQILGPLRTPVPFTAADAGVVENPSFAVSYAWVVEALRNCP